MRKTKRTSRVGETIRDALVEVFRRDMKDERLMMLSVTDVEVSPDLHLARVFVSGLKEDETKQVVKDLNAQRGRVRHFLGQRIRLRVTPDLDFRYDETPSRAGRIEELLAEIKKNEEKN
ncbi:MAG TPA: 30S ribosome-binding factor RbfA [Thermoanaerobaculia bacterium]|nr:30S ribosome-binding factor RbfA [Thermoanaerobaculia bacterium]